jgi:hypothetical protein
MLLQSGAVRGAAVQRDRHLEKQPDWIFQFPNKHGIYPSLGHHYHFKMKVFLIDLPDPLPLWSRAQTRHFVAAAKTAAKLLKEKKTILCICVSGKERSRALAHAAAALAGEDASHIATPSNPALRATLARVRRAAARRAARSG